MDAIALVDSLLAVMPLKPAGIQASKRAIVAQANNSYPSFRGVAEYIYNQQVVGHTDDPDRIILENLDSVTVDALAEYYKQAFHDVPLHHIIVGDRKTLPMDELAKLGKIVELKQKDIYK